MDLVSKKDAAGLYAERPPWSKKGDFGRVLCIGGSCHYPTAPALVSLAAMKTGVDWSYILAPERAANICSSLSPDIMSYPLEGDFLKKSHVEFTTNFMKKYNAAVIGNGMGKEKETQDAVKGLLQRMDIPAVIDADAIHAVSKNTALLRKNFILTPHSNEFLVLTGEIASTEVKERAKIVTKHAKKFSCTILLKGHVDIISDGRSTKLNKTGHPVMAKAGTGDVLAGIAGALLARGGEPFKAACAAAYINGLAGELAEKEYGESLAASDIIENIHKVLSLFRK